jgi:hypothetical protein
MPTAERLRAEIAALKARRPARRSVSADRLAFAREAADFTLDAWQGEMLRSEAPRILLNIHRQGGKSTTTAILALHKALADPGSLVLLLAPSERQSKELFTKIAAMYRGLGHPLPADSHRKLGMELAGGSRIEALPGVERTVRGFSGVDLLVVDEASRVADGLYHAVRPMLAVSGGRLVLLSTPYGKRGVFFEEWSQGSGWERYEVPASECPRISPEFLEEERRSLPARVHRQEYECSFEETDDAVFAFEDVAGAMSEEVAPLFGNPISGSPLFGNLAYGGAA